MLDWKLIKEQKPGRVSDLSDKQVARRILIFPLYILYKIITIPLVGTYHTTKAIIIYLKELNVKKRISFTYQKAFPRKQLSEPGPTKFGPYR